MPRAGRSAIASALLLLVMGAGVVLPEAGHTRAHRHASGDGHDHDAAPHPATSAPGPAFEALDASHAHGHPDLTAAPGTRPSLGGDPVFHSAPAAIEILVRLAHQDRAPPQEKPPDNWTNGPPPPARSPPLT